MKIFRTLSTTRLLSLIAAVVAVVVAGTIAVAARGGSGATPQPKPLATAIHDALTAQHPVGITGRISFTNKLFPSGALTGQTGSALMSSATGRLWMNANGGRIELQSDGGDAQITWNDTKATIYDASSNTAYVISLPAKSGSGSGSTHTPPSLDAVTAALAKAAQHWAIGGAVPTNVGNQEAYSVTVSPKHDGGLLGSAELAWDAVHGVPLRIAITAQGSSSPVLALEATGISFGSVPDSDVNVTPPAGAKVVDLSSAGHGGGGGGTPAVSGLAAVQAAAPFTVVAPDTLVGLPRKDVRLVGPADSRSVLVTYGQGLGAILVVERQPGGGSGAAPGGLLSALPSVSLDGITAHELATQLGTVLTWDRSGVSYVLAGSIPPAAAESAARALR